jgi:hypothetical protein
MIAEVTSIQDIIIVEEEMQAAITTVTTETVTLTSTKDEATAFIAALNTAIGAGGSIELTAAVQAYNAAGIV